VQQKKITKRDMVSTAGGEGWCEGEEFGVDVDFDWS